MKDFDVLVIGGGYAGVLAVLRAKNGLGPRGRVGLVSDQPDLIERTRLHEAATHGRNVRVPLARLLGPAIEAVVGAVSAIRSGEVVLGSGEVLHAKAVIVATGLPMRSAIPGAALLEGDGLTLHPRIVQARGRPLVVIGGGLTGIELAGELAEAGHRVTLVTPGPLGAQDLGDTAAEACRQALRELGVELRRARAREVVREEVRLEDGEIIPAALAIATVGMSGPRPFGLAAADARLVAAPGVLLAGDLAAADVGVRTGCKSAMPLGAHAADNAVRLVTGEPLEPFSWRFFGSCVSVGRRRAVVEAVWQPGEPGTLFTGRIAAWIKEQILGYTIGSMDLERRRLFSYRWPKERPARLLPRAA